ncbi:hypothetical protein HRED_08533 [Candidatus Haloredivivus sp. G17]|nr:hypothetical protein HRED_08533 [Candidatus Haloredivivus sp. G17]
MQGDKVQNILMVDPDTLTGRSDTLYAPDSVTEVMAYPLYFLFFCEGLFLDSMFLLYASLSR